MSDFFESDNTSLATAGPAGAVDREMRRQELRRADQRRWATRAIAVALAVTVVTGGGFAAYAASHPTTTKKVATATKTHAKSAKHKATKKATKHS